MSQLRINLLGRMRLRHGDSLVEARITRMLQRLLGYLLIHRHRLHSREVLGELFWGDYHGKQSRGCLSTALWRLRTVLEPHGVARGAYLLTSAEGEVGFNRLGDYWLDVAAFEDQVGRLVAKPVQDFKPEQAGELAEGLRLYTGDLLEGLYDDWALRERERLRFLNLKGLVWLMRYHGLRGAYEDGVAYGQQVLAMDPLREEIHREVMRLYVANGQRALAIRHYKACCQILKEELGIPPMEETQELFARIIRGGSSLLESVPPRPPEAEGTNVAEALQRLHFALRGFEEIHQLIRGASQLLKALPGRPGPVKAT